MVWTPRNLLWVHQTFFRQSSAQKRLICLKKGGNNFDRNFNFDRVTRTYSHRRDNLKFHKLKYSHTDIKFCYDCTLHWLFAILQYYEYFTSWLNKSLHAAKPFLRILQSLSKARNSPHFKGTRWLKIAFTTACSLFLSKALTWTKYFNYILIFAITHNAILYNRILLGD